MSTLFYIVVNRCLGTAPTISKRTNFFWSTISQQQISCRENVLRRIHIQTLSLINTSRQQLVITRNSHARHLSTETRSDKTPTEKPFGDKPEEKKLSLYQRLKAMYKDYWYVLVPVHCITSACWYGGFYYLAKSGVDIVALLESLNISEKLIQPLRDGHSTTGYLALAYALYKISTPLRYTVTLGGTTISINYLKRWGYIKPMLSKEQLKVIYKDRKETFQERRQELKDSFQEKKQEIKDAMKKFKDVDNSKKNL